MGQSMFCRPSVYFRSGGGGREDPEAFGQISMIMIFFYFRTKVDAQSPTQEHPGLLPV